MSGGSIGSLVGAVIGGVIGTIVPVIGTTVGLAVGSLLGGLAGTLYDTFTADDTVTKQQTIADLSIQTSTFGNTIVQVYGKAGNLAGNVIWATPKQVHEERHSQHAGKGGGPSQVTITKTYTISMAIALCDTRVFDVIQQIDRIYRDLVLIYDRNQDPALPDGWTFYDGDPTQPVDPVMEADLGVGNVPRYPYCCYVVIENDNLGASGRTYNYTFELSQGDQTLSRLVTALCDAADITPDLTDLPVATDVGLQLVTMQAIRAPLEQLAQAYRFYVLESGLTLAFRELGTSSLVFDIPEDDLDAGPDEATTIGLAIERLDSVQLPTELDVTFIDPAQHWQKNTQRFMLGAQVIDLEEPRTVVSALTLPATQGKQMAQELALSAWIQRETVKGTLGRKYAHLEPGDRGTITARGLTYTVVLLSTSYGHPGIMEITGRLDAAFVRAAVGAAPGVVLPPVQTVSVAGDTTPLLLNLPALTTNDQAPRYHVAYIGEQEPWPGGNLYRSIDNEATYDVVDTGFLEGITGTVALALADVDYHFLDTTTTFTVVLEYDSNGSALTTISDLGLYNGQQLVLVGDEILGVGVADLVAPKTYECSRLLRGRRGTEWAVPLHGPNETFVLLDASIHAVGMTMADRYVERPYKGVTFGQNIAAVLADTFTPTAANLNPWEVAQPDAQLSGADWIFTWMMRSRFNGDWVDNQGIGFDPDFTGFLIHVFADNTYTVAAHIEYTDGGNPLVADIEKTWTYTSAAQTADFGSPQATLYYRIYQLTTNGISRPFDLVAP